MNETGINLAANSSQRLVRERCGSARRNHRPGGTLRTKGGVRNRSREHPKAVATGRNCNFFNAIHLETALAHPKPELALSAVGEARRAEDPTSNICDFKPSALSLTSRTTVILRTRRVLRYC
jgi:hypothetical protein